MKRQRKHTDTLWADVPIQTAAHDELGRAAFAATMSKTIRLMKGDDSFVFAICGPWGCGKSSVLRLIRSKLEASKSNTKPIVVDFNPWWFSGREQLLTCFLMQLAAVLERPDAGTNLSKLGKTLNTFATVLRPFGYIPGAGIIKDVGEVLAAGGEASTSLGDRLSRDVHRLREEIDGALKESKRRIVVIMDDIDRLTAHEIAQLFVIVKAVANFPNTVYLLSFDHAVVAKAIGQQLGLDGAAYLEKIVQIHIDVPPASPILLQQLFLHQLNALITEKAINDQNKKDFLNTFHDGVKSFLETPRSVKRLTNVLRVLYPGLAHEVHWPDFIGITVLQVFVPEAYSLIRDNKDRFTGIQRHSLSEAERTEEKTFHQTWIEGISPKWREHVSDLTKRLFPRVRTSLGGISFGPGITSRWEADLRICAAEHFDRYFQFRVPEGAISEAEWRSFLEKLSNNEATDTQIKTWCAERGPNRLASRAKEFLAKTQVFARHRATLDEARSLLSAILRNGDALIAVRDSERVIIMSIDNELRLMWAVLTILEKIPEDHPREESLIKAFDDAGLSTMTNVVLSLGRQHGRFGTEPKDNLDPPLVSEGCLDRLIKITIARLEKAAGDGELVNSPKPLNLAYYWKTFADSDDAKRWVEQTYRDDAALARLIRTAQTTIASHAGDDRIVTEEKSASARSLLMWFDGIELRRRCQSILAANADWLKEEDKSALELILESIDEKGEAIDPFKRAKRGYTPKK